MLLVVLGVIVTTAVWWLLFIGPRNDAIADADSQRDFAENEARVLTSQIARLNAIKDQEISYLFAIGEMETSIPTEPEFDAFIEDLTFLAERSGVDIIAVTANPPQDTDVEDAANLFEIRVNLSLEGQFFEILGLLYGLEELERLVRVDSIDINPITIVDSTTTTTTAAPDSSTSSTSSTTTTTEDPRLRPTPGELSVSLSATLFTRMPVAAPVAPGAEGEGESQ